MKISAPTLCTIHIYTNNSQGKAKLPLMSHSSPYLLLQNEGCHGSSGSCSGICPVRRGWRQSVGWWWRGRWAWRRVTAGPWPRPSRLTFTRWTSLSQTKQLASSTHGSQTTLQEPSLSSWHLGLWLMKPAWSSWTLSTSRLCGKFPLTPHWHRRGCSIVPTAALSLCTWWDSQTTSTMVGWPCAQLLSQFDLMFTN